MTTFHPTIEQVVDWWEHRLADLRANLATMERELAEGEDTATTSHDTLADRAMQLHNDIVEVERVLVEWQKLAGL